MLASKMKIVNGRVKTKDAVYTNGYIIKPSPESQTWVVLKDGDVVKRFNDYESAYKFAMGTKDSKMKDVSGFVVRTIGSYKIIEGTGIDGGWWFAKEFRGTSPLEIARFKTKNEAEEHAEQSQPFRDSKTRDRNLVDINQERRRLEDKYEQALRDGDKGLAKTYSDRLEELRKEAIEAENKRDEERKNFGDSKTKDKKMRDGQSYNMAVEYELFTYYNIPRNQARPIVERNSQELQKKEDAGVSARNAADMLMHKEGIKGFEKIYVRPNDSKDAVDPTKPKNIAAAKNLSVAQGKAASDGGPGSGQKGHKSAHRIPDPSTHQERRKERANLQKYIENARRSGNIKEAQKHSQRLAHINSLQLKG